MRGTKRPGVARSSHLRSGSVYSPGFFVAQREGGTSFFLAEKLTPHPNPYEFLTPNILQNSDITYRKRL